MQNQLSHNRILLAGALILFNSPGTPQFQRVSLPLVILVALFIGVSFAIIVGFALRARKAPIRTGVESLTGRTGVATTALNPDGQVQVAGELWSALADPASGRINKGDRVEVVSGLKEGERVATSGTFLLDSESRMKPLFILTKPSALRPTTRKRNTTWVGCTRTVAEYRATIGWPRCSSGWRPSPAAGPCAAP